MTILSKTDTGETDRAGDAIFAFSKEVVAFENTQLGLVENRSRLIDRQGILSRLLTLVDGGDDVRDIIGTTVERDALQSQADKVAADLVTIDEALALFP